MDGIVVLETIEFAPNGWWLLLKIFCIGVNLVAASALFGLAVVAWDGNSEFIVHEILAIIGFGVAIVLFLASATWIGFTPTPVEQSYPREIVSVDSSVDINEFCQRYDVIDYKDDGTFVVHKKD